MVEINFHPTSRELRQFGFIALFCFGVLGGSMYWRKSFFGLGLGEAADRIAYVMWGVGALSALCSLTVPSLNRFLYVGVSLITFPIGYLVSHALMILLFYGVITPLGLVFRFAGRDPLHRRFEPQAKSYWVSHQQSESAERYFQQF